MAAAIHHMHRPGQHWFSCLLASLADSFGFTVGGSTGNLRKHQVCGNKAAQDNGKHFVHVGKRPIGEGLGEMPSPELHGQGHNTRHASPHTSPKSGHGNAVGRLATDRGYWCKRST